MTPAEEVRFIQLWTAGFETLGKCGAREEST
jgi:hypothetical protein